jgi:hypothetical protein
MKIRLALACASLLAATSVLAMGQHGKPSCDGSAADVETAVMTTCDCANAATHGQFVRCAAHIVKDFAAHGNLPKNCRGPMVRAFAKSTCGKPSAVTCCLEHDTVKTCLVRKATVCERLGGTPGTGPLCADGCVSGSPSGAFVN